MLWYEIFTLCYMLYKSDSGRNSAEKSANALKNEIGWMEKYGEIKLTRDQFFEGEEMIQYSAKEVISKVTIYKQFENITIRFYRTSNSLVKYL